MITSIISDRRITMGSIRMQIPFSYRRTQMEENVKFEILEPLNMKLYRVKKHVRENDRIVVRTLQIHHDPNNMINRRFEADTIFNLIYLRKRDSLQKTLKQEDESFDMNLCYVFQRFPDENDEIYEYILDSQNNGEGEGELDKLIQSNIIFIDR